MTKEMFRSVYRVPLLFLVLNSLSNHKQKTYVQTMAKQNPETLLHIQILDYDISSSYSYSLDNYNVINLLMGREKIEFFL